MNQPIITITFQDDLEGTIKNISVNYDSTVEELLKLYFKEININYSFNNGKKLELNDKTKIGQFMNLTTHIIVINQGNLLGGQKNLFILIY